ncbi:hypothetical protein WJX81_000833 [Elliptochloris bilobata]|uniref:Mitochondrial carrier protein n=1 Tax=Elliptochloris bilobata TaxID=381761 RepID=A0AAW1SEA3_9CHLO
MQLQKASFGTAAAAPGSVATVVSLVRNEGIFALYSGFAPAVLRGLTYGGVRLGAYGPVKSLLSRGDDSSSILRKLTAGCISGAVAAAATNPIDLIKTRLQAKGSPYRSSTDVVRHIVREHGVRGLWVGSTPSMARAAVLTSVQCAVYDGTKRWWMAATGMTDGPATHLGASMVTGLATTTATTPVDVVKTNMFAGGVRYTSAWACAADIVRSDGPLGLLKGWLVQYLRLGPQTVVIFVVMEKLRTLSGLASF